MMSKKFFFTVNDQKRDIDESTFVWTLIDNGKLANQIARLLAIVVKRCAWLDVQRALHPTPNPQLPNRSLLLYDKSGETGFQCNLCNGGFRVLCIPDSLSLIYEGKKVYENPLYVKLILMMQSQLLLSHGMRKRSVRVFILIENGVALWLLYLMLLSMLSCRGEAGHRQDIWTELRVSVQMPHPRAFVDYPNSN